MNKIKRTIAFLTAALLLMFCLPMFATAMDGDVPAPDEDELEVIKETVDTAAEASEDTADDTKTTEETPAEEPPAETAKTTNYYVKDDLHAVREVAPQTYTGNKIQPALDITYFLKDANGVTSEIALKVQEDYVVTYNNNVDVTDKAKIVISYVGKYKVLGEESFEFRIAAKNVSKTASIKEIADQPYTGKPVEPALTVKDGSDDLIEGADYVVTYKNNTNIGTASAIVEFFGNYAGEAKVDFLIRKLAARSAVIAPIPAQAYTGEAIEPELNITCDGDVLVPGEDYDVAFKNNTNAGTAIVTVTYKGVYSGSKTVTFQIVQVKDGEEPSGDAKDYALNITGISDVFYNGKAQEPTLKITNGSKELVLNEDYKVSYKDNINVGKATVIITLMGKNYSGVRTEHFNIRPYVVSQGTIAKINNQPYAFGRPVTPDALVTVSVGGQNVNLEEGVDYEFEYTNNRKVGTAGIKAVFIGNYSGSLSSSFVIEAADISDACIAPIPDQKHTGNPVTPKVKVYVGKHKLKKDRDYTVAYSNNTAIGQATVTVTFKGNYKGTATASFNITETGSRGIAQTGEIGAAVVGGIAVVAGVTFFIVKKRKNNEDED